MAETEWVTGSIILLLRGPITITPIYDCIRGPPCKVQTTLRFCYVLKILLMEYIPHQLTSSFHRSIYKGFIASQVVQDFNHQQS